jgi:outer membrane protein OmpA-like peptidoglycan-associated protein
VHLRFVACAVLALAACSSSKPNVAPIAATKARDDGPWLVMERFACLGECPAYVLTVHADGRVEFVGKNAYADGRHEKKLDPSSMAELRAAFDAARFTKMARRYDAMTNSDQAGADLALRAGAGWKEVEFHVGDPSTPPELVALANRVDEIVGTLPWIDLDRGVVLRSKIYFSDHDAKVVGPSAEVLAAIAETLKAHPGLQVKVVGHAAVDEPEWLARVRAFVVRRALVDAGVEGARLIVADAPSGVVATPDEDDPLAKQRSVGFERIAPIGGK